MTEDEARELGRERGWDHANFVAAYGKEHDQRKPDYPAGLRLEMGQRGHHMSDLPDDLEMCTVTVDGDPDQMGVVVSDWRGENVKVSFDGGLTAEYIPRDRLEDVTELYDYAFQWGLTDENQAD